MPLRWSARTWVPAIAAAVLVAGVSGVSATGQPGSATVVSADSVPAYQAFPSDVTRSIPRGRWVDLATYRTPMGTPVTHNVSLALDIRRATGPRPTFIKVSWVRDKGAGWDRTGSQVYALPTSAGDNPFYVTHEHTIGGVRGLAKAQVFIPGSGSVPLRSSLVQAIAFPPY